MENFKLFSVEHEEFPLLLIILFCHSKVNQKEKIIGRLNEMNYEGWVLVDNLMQTGVEGLRFYKTYFKETFQDEGFPVTLPIDSIYRRLTCDFLRENNLATGSSLSTRKINAINNGEVI